MSKNINVNPGQYKIAGRERQGEDVDHERNRAARSRMSHELKERSRRKQTVKNARGK